MVQGWPECLMHRPQDRVFSAVPPTPSLPCSGQTKGTLQNAVCSPPHRSSSDLGHVRFPTPYSLDLHHVLCLIPYRLDLGHVQSPILSRPDLGHVQSPTLYRLDLRHVQSPRPYGTFAYMSRHRNPWLASDTCLCDDVIDVAPCSQRPVTWSAQLGWSIHR